MVDAAKTSSRVFVASRIFGAAKTSSLLSNANDPNGPDTTVLAPPAGINKSPDDFVSPNAAALLLPSPPFLIRSRKSPTVLTILPAAYAVLTIALLS
jgi:hypothetical protein